MSQDLWGYGVPGPGERTAEWDEAAARVRLQEFLSRMKEQADGLRYVTPHPGKTLAVGPKWSGSVPDGHPNHIPRQAEQDDIHGYLDHDDDGHVNFVYTAPALRGFGVGSRLLDHAGIADIAHASRFTSDGQKFHDALERRRTAHRTAMPAPLPHKDNWEPGEQAHYEYHCLQSPNSSDYHLWQRSHQPVTVLGPSPEADDFSDVYPTLRERGEQGLPRVYRVRFGDGHEDDAWEDELLTHPQHFSPLHAPPKHAHRTAMPTWHHLTHNPDFTLDPDQVPTNFNDHDLGAGVFLTRRPEQWADDPYGDSEWSANRPYIADIDAPHGLHRLPGTWYSPYAMLSAEELPGSEEIFVPADQFHHLTVQRVRPRTAMPEGPVSLYGMKDVARHMGVTLPAVTKWMANGINIPPYTHHAGGRPFWDSLGPWQAWKEGRGDGLTDTDGAEKEPAQLFSSADIARMMGVSPAAVSKWVSSGKAPAHSHLASERSPLWDDLRPWRQFRTPVIDDYQPKEPRPKQDVRPYQHPYGSPDYVPKSHRTAMPWYHVSPHDIAEGDDLIPRGMGSHYDDNLYSEDGNEWRGDHVWVTDHINNARAWQDQIEQETGVRPHNIYEVEPHGRPEQDLEDNYYDSPPGFFTDRATVIKRIKKPKKARTMTAAVTVYTKPSCPQCDMTHKLLNRLGVEHTTVDVTADPDAHAYVTGLGYQSAPVVVVGDGERHWSGFKVDELKKLVGGE